jgi:hypothetical protein
LGAGSGSDLSEEPVCVALVLAWTRMGMEILFNQYGDWAYQHNAVQYRAEEPVAIGVQYPKAVAVVTGLNPGLGS